MKLKPILITGIIAGTLDILAAILIYSVVMNKVKPLILLQGIAGGVFGKAAFESGTTMALLGLLFHYFIATSFTATYFYCYSKLKIMETHPIILGLIYGIIVWCVMNLIVLPLSNVAPTTIKLIPALRAIVILIFCIGIPIAMIAKRFVKK